MKNVLFVLKNLSFINRKGLSKREVKRDEESVIFSEAVRKRRSQEKVF